MLFVLYKIFLLCQGTGTMERCSLEGFLPLFLLMYKGVLKRGVDRKCWNCAIVHFRDSFVMVPLPSEFLHFLSNFP